MNCLNQQSVPCVLSVINEYLIPDLANLVLKYCWPKKRKQILTDILNKYLTSDLTNVVLTYKYWVPHINMSFTYGDYESALILLDAMGWEIMLYWSCYGGYIKIINLIINKFKEKIYRSSWRTACRGAYAGGHNDIIIVLIEKCKGDVFTYF